RKDLLRIGDRRPQGAQSQSQPSSGRDGRSLLGHVVDAQGCNGAGDGDADRQGSAFQEDPLASVQEVPAVPGRCRARRIGFGHRRGNSDSRVLMGSRMKRVGREPWHGLHRMLEGRHGTKASLLSLAALVAFSIGTTSTPLAAPLPVLGPPLAAAKGGNSPNHENKDKAPKVKKSKKQPGTPGTPTPGDEKGKKDARAKHAR